jgi:hypothetical protein
MAEGSLAFDVRLLAEPTTPGHLHLTWVQAAGTAAAGFSGDDNPVLTARSDDGGATWAPPVTVSTTGHRRAVAPAPAIRGDSMFVSFLDVKDDRLDYNGAHQGMGGEPYRGTWAPVVARSPDRGATWREAVVDSQLVPIQRFIDLFAPTPSIAPDPGSKHVHVAFHDGRLGDPDVLVWTSGDDGVSWAG